jgi:hypothetical protein
MAQRLDPDSGVEYTNIDDGASANDADYHLEGNVWAPVTNTWTFSNPASTPNGSTGTLTVRLKGVGDIASWIADGASIVVEVSEGATQRGSRSDIANTLTANYQDFTVSATGITNYNNMGFAVTAGGAETVGIDFYISWAKFDAPDPAGGGGGTTSHHLTVVGAGT